jgi:hypothetical protein
MIEAGKDHLSCTFRSTNIIATPTFVNAIRAFRIWTLEFAMASFGWLQDEEFTIVVIQV